MAPKRFETLRRSIAMSDLDMNSDEQACDGMAKRCTAMICSEKQRYGKS
jgi:hypothetical protein